MQCLYCGKQLALLRRLTGGGEFCSDAHKHSYQEEYNRLALSRLLQAQSKPGEIKVSAKAPAPVEGLGQPLPPGASRRRALPEGSPTADHRRAPIIAGPVTSPPVAVEETVQEPVAEAQPLATKETTVQAVEETLPPEVVEEEPQEVAVFSMEIPAFLSLPDEIPYIEPGLEIASVPLSPLWQAPNQYSAPSMATLAALYLVPPAGDIQLPALVTDVAPQEFARATLSLSALSDRSIANLAPSRSASEVESQHPFSSLPSAGLLTLEISSPASGTDAPVMGTAAAPQNIANPKVNLDVPFAGTATPPQSFPAALPIALDIRVSAYGTNHQSSLNGVVRFPIGIAFHDAALLNLCPSGIDFPAEDAEVALVAAWGDAMFSRTSAPESVGESALATMEPSPTPREALEALSRLHQDLVEEQESAEPPAATPVADFELLPPPPEPNDAVAATPVEPPAATIEISAEPVDDRPAPRAAHELFTIPLKTFPPSKPGLAVEASALLSLSLEMPRLKALPLRPKVAKAPPGFSPQPAAVPVKGPVAENKVTSPEPTPQPRPDVRTKQVPASEVKQPAPPVKSAPAQPGKPGQPVKPAQPVKPLQTVKPPQTAKAAQPVQTAKSRPIAPTQPKPQVQAQSEQPVQPSARETQRPASPPPAPAGRDRATAPAAAEESMPTFATLQPAKNASFGSLKVKLVIAILLVVIAGGAYFGWSGKSHTPVSAQSATEESVGPSIMLGEGGWVQGWAGDPNGSHAGRQITIYRPSLKLSDYRIEFQGEIDTKSIGWVFRALDPYNYYAMKLASVTPGLSPKIALIKYSVVQGHETEVGRVPVNIAARLDTMFSVRVDVRGSKFSTYVQGQPVDVWTDVQLKSGGVGFLNERAERARIKSVSISYLTGGKN